MSLHDERGSVVTLARSASHQVSRVWGHQESSRLSADGVADRPARSEADVSQVQFSPDVEQPLIAQAYDMNHDTSSEISAAGQDVARCSRCATSYPHLLPALSHACKTCHCLVSMHA